MEKTLREEIERTCREVFVPLVEADGGELFLVKLSTEGLHLHLSGTCSGCPGVVFTRDKVVIPAIHAVAPRLEVEITTGPKAPVGAVRMRPGA